MNKETLVEEAFGGVVDCGIVFLLLGVPIERYRPTIIAPVADSHYLAAGLTLPMLLNRHTRARVASN